MKEFKGLIKAKKTNDIYQVMGDDIYKNLSTGKSGKIRIEDAKKLFIIPIQLNNMAVKNPLVIDLIEELGLSLEPYTEDEKFEFLFHKR